MVFTDESLTHATVSVFPNLVAFARPPHIVADIDELASRGIECPAAQCIIQERRKPQRAGGGSVVIALSPPPRNFGLPENC